jgi:hypothetical protein
LNKENKKINFLKFFHFDSSKDETTYAQLCKKETFLNYFKLCCVLCEHFPLTVSAKEKTLEKREINLEFIKNFLPRLDYSALKGKYKF